MRNGCKINLGLYIVGRTKSGCHELDSIFFPLPYPCDTLLISRSDQPGIRVCGSPRTIDPENNTLTKAYAAFVEAAGTACGMDVLLQKRIPVGAGLGGGSANAASLLLWLNEECGTPLNPEKMADVALKVGADTPFFLQSSPCRVQGIGERLCPVSFDLSGYWLVLVCPGIQVNTGRAYKAYDALPPSSWGQNGLTEFAAQAKESPLFNKLRDIYPGDRLKDGLVNDLERAVFPEYPLLSSIKATLLDSGAEAACMSGSGSSLFGLFASHKPELAQKASLCLRAAGRRVFLLRM